MKKEKIIEIKGLEKHFGDVMAVNGLSFSVGRGELFAFLGVNGAGKSTTISIMTNELQRDSGEVLVCGLDPAKHIRELTKKIGVVFQSSVLDMPLSVRDNLESRAALCGLSGKAFDERLSELASLLDFESILRRPVGKLSGGQRRRVDIARALLMSPELLILDEPTTGLDPQTRVLLRRTIADMQRNTGMTVLLTTHYMEEAADADYVLIIDGGKAVAEGSPLELKNRFTADRITLYNPTDEDLSTVGMPFEHLPDGVSIAVRNTSDATEIIRKHPEVFRDYEITKGKMDDVFLAATGKRPEGGDKNDRA